MSDKFSLKWNDYQANWTRALTTLRNDTESVDVTLISDDKVKFAAHKILLTSCSNLFKYILKGSTHANPLVYLSGVSSVNLSFILDYIYYGEVKLFQEQLDCFLESAQKLEIEGLLGDKQNQEKQESGDLDVYREQERIFEQEEEYIEPTEDKRIDRMGGTATLKQQKYSRAVTSNHVAAKYNVESMTQEEIDIKMRELYQKNDGVWSCLACDYSTRTNSGDIRKHVELHLGLSYNCSLCNKIFRCAKSLYYHKKRCNQ